MSNLMSTTTQKANSVVEKTCYARSGVVGTRPTTGRIFPRGRR